jgi:hypothetical protein
MLLLLLTFLLPSSGNEMTSVPSTGFGTVRFELADHEGVPVKDAEVRVWTRFPPTKFRPFVDWRGANIVRPYGRDGFEVPNAWEGHCTLVARYDSPSAVNFVVREFDLAAGGIVDLGRIRPTGRERRFELAVYRLDGQERVDLDPTKTPGMQLGNVEFELSSTDPDADRFAHCKLTLSAGSVATVRGLDAIGNTFAGSECSRSGDLETPRNQVSHSPRQPHPRTCTQELRLGRDGKVTGHSVSMSAATLSASTRSGPFDNFRSRACLRPRRSEASAAGLS